MTTDAFARERRLDSRVRVALIGLLVLVTLAWFVAAIVKPKLAPDNFTHSHTGAPGGHRALVELLEKRGHTVERTVSRLELPTGRWNAETLMVLEPRYHEHDEFRGEFRDLIRQAQTEHGSFVLALPKREYTQHWMTEEPGTVELRERAAPLARVAGLLASTELGDWFEVRRLPGAEHPVDGVEFTLPNSVAMEEFVQVLRLRDGVFALPENIQPLAQTEAGDFLAVRLRVNMQREEGGFVLVSDPDMFSNRYIAEPGVASLALSVLNHIPSHRKILIDESLHGLAHEASVEYLASTVPGLWVTLSVILLMLLFAWREATVLRPASAETNPRDRRLYAIEGLARMLRRTDAHEDAALRIRRRGALVLDQAMADHGGGLSAEELDALDTNYVMDGEAVNELMHAARTVSALKRRQQGGQSHTHDKAKS